jgi:hypothetical protein
MKPAAHKHITKSVLMSFKFNLGFSPREMKWIQRGTSLEDWWSPRQRIKNWHFYRANDFIKEKEFFILGKSYTTSEKRVEKLISKVKSKVGNRKRFITLGRIIHHIQDMSTPSHVVPIFHGPGKEDVYETHMMEYIESDIDFIINVNLINEADDFRSIYEKYALLSLAHLKDTTVPLLDSPGSHIKYDKLWTPYPQLQDNKYIGFGDFGEYGRCFDGEPLEDSTQINIKAIYEHFSTQAAQSTYEALLHFKDIYKGK